MNNTTKDKKPRVYKRALNQSDFVAHLCKKTMLERVLVETIVNAFIAWIGDMMASEKDVSLKSIGKFKVVPNKKQKTGVSMMHSTSYANRPVLRFSQSFKRRIGIECGIIQENSNQQQCTEHTLFF